VFGATVLTALGASNAAHGFPEQDQRRRALNNFIRRSGLFDGVVDFDEAVHDPSHPTQLLPTYDSGDHLHVNNAGNVAQGNAIPLALFHVR